ncbi:MULTISPECIES: hypothetical protein [unclassified Gordonia (in: high G+C Gram-positive bacteria)]|uniref:hypothetical protein n=1 Tax=unclassified Gordonia (in: high G+C Gram-positive bacteria) TaxID=2657482 RepID=UPI00071D35D6|nr:MULTISPECIES: hypothetical protein [unclassified Gordonia (in: high G+C Gram-positive bacteria)]KSU59645.1 hypothetical protein AS181_06485 [Gordonia sp. SGD-V-85]SCC02598.1 hypothetical protein GA0061091_104204 [Gordonia sp. v-85]
MGVPDEGMADRMMAAVERSGGFGPSGGTPSPEEDEVLDVRVRLRMLDQAADLLHDVLVETPKQDPRRDHLRSLTFAVKDLADELHRNTQDSRADRSGDESGPGGAPTPSGARVSNPHQESENY